MEVWSWSRCSPEHRNYRMEGEQAPTGVGDQSQMRMALARAQVGDDLDKKGSRTIKKQTRNFWR